MQFFRKYPKVESHNDQGYVELGPSAQQNIQFSDDQIITEIEEKIFDFMMANKVKILKLHEMIDKDKSQSIGRTEFKTFFKNKIKVDLTRRDLDVVFKTFDKDNDGSISVKEFVEHLKKAINNRNSLK